MTRHLIVASNRLDPAVAKRLQAVGELHAPQGEAPMTAEEMRPLLARAHAFMGFMTDRVDRTWLEQAPELRIVAAALKGFDNYDVQACEAAGVWLSIVPDLLTEPTAELALGLAIALGRHLREGDHRVRSGEFSGWRPVLYGTGLAGATVGVVGLGAVGRAIIDRLQGFGVARILGVDPRAEDARVAKVELRAALEGSDFLFLAAPLGPGSHHLLDEAALACAQPDLLIINVGRGSVVEEEAVASALEQQRLGGYAADVFEFEDWAIQSRPLEVCARLRRHPRTVFTPHLGSAVARVRLAIEHRAADNILAALGGAEPPDAINRPLRYRGG
jgi:phosphonate dehydrogenase